MFQAASTPLNPLSFQCGFVKLRIDLLQAFSQLICTCNSLKTSPPPAIATTIAMTSGNDLQRCGRISNQARAPLPLLCSCVCDSGMNSASQQTYLTKEIKSSCEVFWFSPVALKTPACSRPCFEADCSRVCSPPVTHTASKDMHLASHLVHSSLQQGFSHLALKHLKTL